MSRWFRERLKELYRNEPLTYDELRSALARYLDRDPELRTQILWDIQALFRDGEGRLMGTPEGRMRLATDILNIIVSKGFSE